MIGKTLAHYEIVEKIGAGGMGEVYRARDTKLGRDVAVKVLPEEMARESDRLKRFEREARSLAAVSHPGIVSIYSIERLDDCTFLTMELVRGETLAARIARGRMPLHEFMELATSLTEALAAAHECGVVHRDLKPANVMLDAEGRPRILDFGLAKLLEPSKPADATLPATGSLTRTGAVLGTPAYMAPEQIEGGEVDHRADLFALGLILFEAATGRHAFTGESTPAIVSSILRDQVPPVSDLRPEWPRDLSRIIGRCLEKDPRRRFQTARDVYNEARDLCEEVRRQRETPPAGVPSIPARPTQTGRRRARFPLSIVTTIGALVIVAAGLWLWQLRTKGPAPATVADSDRVMIAVLPFESLGGPEDAYFAAGITEEITSRLSGVEGLGVISRTSAAQYAGTAKSIREIGHELGVDFVLEGTVRWAPGPQGRDRVRITPQLIRVADDIHLWTNRYDDMLEDVFAVQTDIARSVVAELGVTLLQPGRESLERKPTTSLAAYQAYLRAKDTSSNLEAVALLERAVELDPSFSEAWAELANAHASLYRFGGDRTPSRRDQADSALAHALALAPDNAEVLRGAAYTYYYAHNDYDRAMATFTRLLDRNPSSARAYEGIAYVHRRQGRFAEALSFLEMASRLDPRDANIVYNLARTRQARRELGKADSLYQRAITLRPDDCGYYAQWAVVALMRSGDVKEATRRVAQCLGARASGHELFVAVVIGDHAQTVALAERLVDARPTLASWRGVMLACRAWGLRGLGRTAEMQTDAEEARSILLKTVQEGPDFQTAFYFLVLTELVLGDHEAALAHAKRAVELGAIDRFEGPPALEQLAIVHAHSGRIEQAVQVLDSLLTMEYWRPLTVPMLRVDARFEPLRGEPEFESLLKRHAHH